MSKLTLFLHDDLFNDPEYVPLSNTNDLTLRQIIDTCYEWNRTAIIKFMQEQIDFDPQEFEGGIDSWFGWGSVMMFELGFKINIELTDQDGIYVHIVHE